MTDLLAPDSSGAAADHVHRTRVAPHAARARWDDVRCAEAWPPH